MYRQEHLIVGLAHEFLSVQAAQYCCYMRAGITHGTKHGFADRVHDVCHTPVHIHYLQVRRPAPPSELSCKKIAAHLHTSSITSCLGKEGNNFNTRGANTRLGTLRGSAEAKAAAPLTGPTLQCVQREERTVTHAMAR